MRNSLYLLLLSLGYSSIHTPSDNIIPFFIIIVWSISNNIRQCLEYNTSNYNKNNL